MSHLEPVDTKNNIIHSLQSSQEDGAETDYNLSQVTIRCPFLQNCDDFVKISELELHSVKHHKQCIYYDKFYYNLTFGCCFISLLVKNQELFLIYCFIYNDDCWFSVFHFSSILKKLQCNVTLTRSDVSVFSRTLEVLPFDETVHCPRCMFGHCSLKFHKFSRAHARTSSRFSHIKNPHVGVDVLRRLGNGYFECTIDILGFDFLVGVDQKYCWCNCNNNVIREALRCIVCTEYMTSIRLCRNGHTICTICKEKNPECYCKAEFGELRCYALEEISHKFQLPCQNETNGCPFVGNTARINIHEERCFYKPKRCT